MGSGVEAVGDGHQHRTEETREFRANTRRRIISRELSIKTGFGNNVTRKTLEYQGTPNISPLGVYAPNRESRENPMMMGRALNARAWRSQAGRCSRTDYGQRRTPLKSPLRSSEIRDTTRGVEQ